MVYSKYELTGTFFVMFMVLQALLYLGLRGSKWASKLDTMEKRKLYVIPVSQFHAVFSCSLALYCIHGAPKGKLESDRVYGHDAMSDMLCAFSAAYFFYDLFVVLSHLPLDYKFLLHAIVCGAAYWLTQAPFFQYYTVRFLLYELSTPLLNVNIFLQLMKSKGKWVDLTQKLFGASFIGCRVLYGIPLSYDFASFCWSLIEKQKEDPAGQDSINVNVLYFSIFATVSMSSLNVIWVLLALFTSPEDTMKGDTLKAQRKKTN